MDKKTKIVIILLVLALIIMGAIIVLNKPEEKNNNNDIKQSNEVKDAVNWIKNEVTNNTTENEVPISANTIEDVEESKTDNALNQAQQQEKSNEEKAIEMVKNDWGKDDNVTFKIDEQIDDAKYTVSVIDKNTTQVIMWYEVDVKNNTIEEK